MEKLIVIEGTNASGKSGLGVRLAEKYGGEIVSAAGSISAAEKLRRRKCATFRII